MNDWWKDILAAIAVLIGILLLARNACGELVEVGPVRQVQATGVLGELESRLSPRDAAYYHEADRASCGHYWGHAMNAAVRNRHGGTGRVNASYMPGGVALLLPEPKGVTLTEVRRQTANPDRMMLTTDEWNNQPLYLLDELSAYCCGAVAGIENDSRERAEQSVGFAGDVYEHCLVMARLARARGYSHADELDAFLVRAGQYIEQLTFKALDPGVKP